MSIVTYHFSEPQPQLPSPDPPQPRPTSSRELTAAVPESDVTLEIRLSAMERPLTVLRVSLHHPTPGPATFANVPPQLEHDTSPLLVGRGPDAHLRLQLPRLSRQHLSLEPYLEKGGARLAFNLKALSRKGCVWVNGLTLRFLEQVPLSTVNRVAFSGMQMVVHIEGGTSLEAFVCCFHLSPSPLIYRLQAEESDEWEIIPQEQPPSGSGQQAPGHLGFLDSPSQPSPGGAPEIQLQREPPDSALC
ncbi:TRAF-interacting protein with FHA domain-containing protein B [Sagmatias obliquidens]|uniref:TRAF-interacting protein with FHA domain-containing protein B n=1 Tax=Sagmatias obliquidens TaxID=3371155 RepID=UPI000F43ECB5|nr:TRAF-interacting protein with FHA domain-containing protein B [Lagenorhynchus obliquidens]XP_026952717.1 TRAF-interacting protein with FHA domain-containing protein B [Lagenorhynchus obliquidens]